jgi:pilus assembly protein CpaB
MSASANLGKGMLIAGLGAGLIAVLMVKSSLSKAEKTLKEASGSTVTVLRATAPVVRGERLGNKVEEVKVPRALLSSAEQVVEAKDKDLVRDSPVRKSVQAGDPIYWSLFRPGASHYTFKQFISKGKRAMSIRLDPKGTVGGTIEPGDHVDLLGTFRRAAGDGTTVEETITLRQNVRIISLGGRDEDKPDVDMIIVEVTPQEVEMLTFAQQRMGGGFSVSLRAPQDTEVVDTGDFDFDRILKRARNPSTSGGGL